MQLDQTPFAPLVAHLLDLLPVPDTAPPPLLEGGFGLYLRRAWREAEGTPILLSALPSVCTTGDFDLMLRLELRADHAKMQSLH